MKQLGFVIKDPNKNKPTPVRLPVRKVEQTPAPAPVEMNRQQRGFWNSLTEGQRKFITWLAIGLGVSVVAVIAFYIIRKQVREARAKKTENESFGQDKHATWAKQFKQGFENDGWWGTDVPLIRQVIRSIPSREDFTEVQKKYRELYKGANLIREMSDELTKMEYVEMLAILNSKPQLAENAGQPIYDTKGWAKRLNAAMNYSWIGFMPGTDEQAILAVFSEFKTQQHFYNTAYWYKKFYGVSLWDDLDGDLNWSLDWRKMLKKLPRK